MPLTVGDTDKSSQKQGSKVFDVTTAWLKRCESAAFIVRRSVYLNLSEQMAAAFFFIPFLLHWSCQIDLL